MCSNEIDHTNLERQRLCDIIRNSKNFQAPDLTSKVWINQYPSEDIGTSLVMPHVNVVLFEILSLWVPKTTCATRFYGSGEMEVNLTEDQLAGDTRKHVWHQQQRLEVASR